MPRSKPDFPWSAQSVRTRLFGLALRSAVSLSICASLGAASPASACGPDYDFRIEQVFSISRLVVSGQIVDRRIVREEVLVAPTVSKLVVGGARFVRPPWDPETATTGDLVELYSLFVDLEVDEVLSGAADKRVTFVIGPFQSDDELKKADFTAGITKAIFMLDDTGPVKTFAPSDIHHRSMTRNKLRVVDLGRNCIQFKAWPAILDTETSTIDFVRKLSLEKRASSVPSPFGDRE